MPDHLFQLKKINIMISTSIQKTIRIATNGKKKKSVLSDKCNYGFNPFVFVSNKNKATNITVHLKEPIFRISINLKNDSIRIVWRFIHDTQIIHCKNVSVNTSNYIEPVVRWKHEGQLLNIDLEEKYS